MDIVVIGNGVAGEAACAAVRSRNRNATLTLISEEIHPFYSPCILAHYISKEVKRSQVFLKSLEDYEKEGIQLLLGRRVEGIDHLRKTVFLSSQQITYDKLILATGSRPIIPKIEGVQRRGVRVLKSLRDADRIIRSQGIKAAIVGAGPIGVELAVALRKRNWEVCLVEALDWILPNQFDEKGASLLRSLMEKQGIEVLTGERVLEIEGRRHVEGIIASRTGRREADLVVLAIGMQPNTELAQEVGIEIGSLGGIRTNDRMETNLEDIFACGDCVEARDPLTGNPKLSLLWPQAERQGWVAGCNSIDENRSVHWLPDVVNLELFGRFAGAMGQSGRTIGAATEIVEKEGSGSYHCMVISDGRIVGAQFIGDREGMGVFFPLIGRGYEELCCLMKEEREIAQFPWYVYARDLLN